MPSIVTNTEASNADLDLVVAAQAGDASAFGQLVRRYSGMVFAVAYARGQDRDTAEDLTQEVFLRAFAGLDSLTQPQYFATWLSRIARNLATDWQRSGQRKSRALAMLSLDEVSEVADPRQVREMQFSEQRPPDEELQMALARLAPEQREIVLLHYAEEWSLTEISRKLNVHRTTVGRHLELALHLLRADIEPLVRSSCRNARPEGKVASRAAAVIVAFAVLPAVSRASVLSQMANPIKAAVPSAAGVGNNVQAGVGILKFSSAAAAAGGKLIMAKTTYTAAAVVIGLGFAGYYAKEKVTPYFAPIRPLANAGAPAGIVQIGSTAPPGTISIKPSTSPNTSMMTGNGEWIGTSVDLQNAIANAYEGYGPQSIIFNGVDSRGDRKDIVIKAPAGHPEQVLEMVQREIPKAYGVNVRQEERQLDVLVLTAPNGDKSLAPATGRGGSRVSGNSATFTATGTNAIAQTLGANLRTHVVDQTNLTGKYNATVTADIHNKDAVIKAVHDQLGLVLTPEKRQVKVLIVDKAV